MIGAINAAIMKYVELTDEYQLDFCIEQDEMLRNLDWDVLKMCIYLTLPAELICKYGSAEQFLSEFEGILKHRNVESEDMSDMDEKRVRRVRIAGYNAFRGGKCVFCFYMLSLLIYTHVMEISGEEERRDFLYSMIIFPCIHRIENQYGTEEEKEDRFYRRHYPLPVFLRAVSGVSERHVSVRPVLPGRILYHWQCSRRQEI